MTGQSDPRNRVLDLLAEGKISAADAKSLLELVSREPRGEESGRDRPGRDRGSRRGRRRERDRDLRRQVGRPSEVSYIRIRVDPRVEAGADAHGDRVNIRIPIAFVKAGAVLTSLLPDSAADRVSAALGQRGIDLDFKNLDADRLEEILAEGGFDIDITEGGVRIRISVE